MLLNVFYDMDQRSLCDVINLLDEEEKRETYRKIFKKYLNREDRNPI